jgi:uncharacterized protein (TIGR03086 family)
MSVPELFPRSVHEFDRRVAAISDNEWTNATPCTDWSVRDLVNHIVSEAAWIPPLLAGKKVDEVDGLEGDLLGDDPKGAWAEASARAIEAVERDGAMDVTAHLSFGDFTGEFYVSQVLCDHVIHAWDLAAGIRDDDTLHSELVSFTYDFYLPADEILRNGVFGPKVEVPDDADPQTKLLAFTGRDRTEWKVAPGR